VNEQVKRVGIVGLGIMGSAMTKHLVAGGFEVHGFDVLADKVAEFEALGGTAHASGAEVAAASENRRRSIAWLKSEWNSWTSRSAVRDSRLPTARWW